MMEKKRVEPAQPDFSKKNRLSQLNPFLIKKNRFASDSAQPDFDKQCVSRYL